MYHIRKSHCKTVIKAHTTDLDWQTQRGHPTNIFGNCDNFRVDIMQHVIGEHEIHNTFLIDGRSKVFVIPSGEARADSMVGIHHAGDTVKPEPVELILIHPESKVGHQETKNFMIPIIEQTTVISDCGRLEIYLSHNS